MAGIETLIDAGDLDLYGKFPRPEIQPEDVDREVYRCHLVEDFLRKYDLPIDKSLVAFSRGVRHSLTVLMEEYKDKSWLLPSDNYPFYSKAAREAGLSSIPYETLTTGSFADLKRSTAKGDVLLATYPFKPSGGSYSTFDWAFLRGWLAADVNRKVILDAVYLFDLSSETELMDFFAESDQVTILYSLSKAYAAPQVAGFTFTKDVNVRERFKALGKDPADLKLCYSLLNSEYGDKRKVEVEWFIGLQWAKAAALGLIPEDSSFSGYLFYSHVIPARHLKNDILAVPASVFGSYKQASVISTLGL